MVTNLIIPEYTDYDPSVNNISDPILHLLDFLFRERRYFKGDSEPGHMKKQLKNQIFSLELSKKILIHLVNFFYLALKMA